LIFHGCKGGLSRYSPPAFAPKVPQYEYERSDVPDADFGSADDRDLLLSSVAAASQRQKQLRNMVDNLRRGDSVVTAAASWARS